MKYVKLDNIKKRWVLIGLVVWYSIAWSWALQTDSLELTGSKWQGVLNAIFVFIINVAIAVYIMKWMIFFAKSLQKKVSKNFIIPTLLLFFAFADFMVAWVPAALWIGPQGRFDSVLPMGSASFLLIHTPLVYAGRFIGFYGLAGFVWTTVYLIFSKSIRRFWFIPLAALSILSIIGWSVYRTTNGVDFNAKLISETLIDRVPAIKPSKEDLVIFPEYGLEKNTGDKLKERIETNYNPNKKTYFLGSEQVFKGQRFGHENRMAFGNTDDGITDRQDKYRLIPGGEDLPFIMRIILRATNQKATLDYFSINKSVIKGQKQIQPLVMSDSIRVGAALCSSIIAPQDYRAFVREGATVLSNSASLTTFKGSSLFAWEQQSLGRFMAVSNSRYFLQSANSASAYAFDNNGKKIGEVRGKNTIDLSVKTNKQKTFYTIYGELMVLFGGVITLYYLANGYINKKHKPIKTTSKRSRPL